MEIKQNDYSNSIWDIDNNKVIEIMQGIVLVDTNLLRGG